MKKLEVIKTASQIVVSVGVGAIVGNAIKYTTPANINIAKKVCIGIGTVVLTNMIGDKAIEYSDQKIDDIASMFQTGCQVEV